jgi:triacylglycerol lipase
VTAYQTGATFEVPIYPLMQQGGTAGVVVPQMAGLISSQIAAHGAPHVSVTGDSAGGNLALAAVQYMVQTPALGQVPSSLVLVSPWLDLQSTGGQIGQVWAGNLPVTDYRVSPGFGSLAGLPPTYVYSGSGDPLQASALALQRAAIAQGIPMTFILPPGEIHDWVLLTPWGAAQYWLPIDQQLGIA